MSNTDQNNQVFREAHNLITQMNNVITYYDNKIRNLEQQIEVLSKNKIQKTETETVPNNTQKKK